jgi:hypothetical protein
MTDQTGIASAQKPKLLKGYTAKFHNKRVTVYRRSDGGFFIVAYHLVDCKKREIFRRGMSLSDEAALALVDLLEMHFKDMLAERAKS